MKKILLYLIIYMACAQPACAQYAGKLAEGDSLMSRHDVFHAMLCYQQAQQMKDGNEIQQRLADCYFRRNDFQRCADLLENAAKASPDSLTQESMRSLFYCYSHLDRKPLQMLWGQRLLQRYPMDSEILSALASLYNRGDSPELIKKALKMTTDYLAVDPTDIAVMQQQADAYFFGMDFTGAIPHYKRLLAMNDTTYNNYYSLGMCYYQLKQYAPARQHLIHAAHINEFKDAGCLYRLGLVCLELDSLDESLNYLKMAEDKLSPDPHVMYIIKKNEGDVYYKSHQTFMAILFWKAALKYDRYRLATIFNLAQGYGELYKSTQQKDAADQEKIYYRSFLTIAEQEKQPTDELKNMIKQAESVVGKNQYPEGVTLDPPL